jgi:hypothetical protein
MPAAVTSSGAAACREADPESTAGERPGSRKTRQEQVFTSRSSPREPWLEDTGMAGM